MILVHSTFFCSLGNENEPSMWYASFEEWAEQNKQSEHYSWLQVQYELSQQKVSGVKEKEKEKEKEKSFYCTPSRENETDMWYSSFFVWKKNNPTSSMVMEIEIKFLTSTVHEVSEFLFTV